MLKLSILLVEDKKYDRLAVKELVLRKELDLSVTWAIAKSYDEALGYLAEGNNYDLSILDVDLGGHRTSFELIEKFRKSLGQIVFLTASAIPARYNKLAQPVLQIEKPFEFEDIVNVISEMRKTRGLSIRKFFIDDDSNVSYVIDEDQIYYIVSAKKSDNPRGLIGDKSIIHFLDKASGKSRQIYSLKGLSDFTKTLSAEQFMKCNGSCLVNITKVIGIDKDTKEIVFDVEMFEKISCSDTYIDAFKRRVISL